MPENVPRRAIAEWTMLRENATTPAEPNVSAASTPKATVPRSICDIQAATLIVASPMFKHRARAANTLTRKARNASSAHRFDQRFGPAGSSLDGALEGALEAAETLALAALRFS